MEADIQEMNIEISLMKSDIALCLLESTGKPIKPQREMIANG